MGTTPSELIREFVDRVAAQPVVARTLVFTGGSASQDRVLRYYHEQLRTSFCQLETSFLNRQTLVAIAKIVLGIAQKNGVEFDSPAVISDAAYEQTRNHARELANLAIETIFEEEFIEPADKAVSSRSSGNGKSGHTPRRKPTEAR